MTKLSRTRFFAATLLYAGRATVLTAIFVLSAAFSPAQAPQARITTAIDSSSRVTVPGSLSPRAVPADDIGAVPASTRLQGITLVFSRTPAQQAALDALIAAQQDPASPQYRQWLTPAQFGARFGVAESDIAAVENWLQQQGFTVDSVSNSRDRIRFTGTVGQAESAFGAPIHYFRSGSETHFAPATAISVPAALASVVQAVTNLSDFRPRSFLKMHAPVAARPEFTSSQTGSYFLDPDDIATIYDITPAYNSGYTGTNQSIAVVGQSSIVTTDITNFQTALGLTPKSPTEVLVPGTGSSAINPFGDGDEAESDLDLEYSGSIAKGATIYFVYTGNNTNTGGVFTALQYAVDEKIAPIVSSSYGDCETDLGSAGYAQLNAILEQAAAQGQTVVSAAGDDGSTSCFGYTDLTKTQQEALDVNFPASSQYVTGVGGTEFPTADITPPNTTYWTSASGADVISSAKSYIPEEVWNDDAAAAPGGAADLLDSGGGGVSTYTARPTWQTGVPGIPSGSYRLVPDVSLDSSDYDAPYLFCSSDSKFTGVTGSCSNGFRDSNDVYLTSGGGTSFAAPIFAGMLALINQSQNSTGLGLVNPTLYTLASNAATYSTAFHDITSGGNQCLAGATYCSTVGESEYPATTGYDEASGLGSIDLDNLLTAWPRSSTTALQPSSTTLTASTTAPASGAADAITIIVAPGAGPLSTAPTGIMSITVDGSLTPTTLTLVNGTATYNFSSTVTGTHVVAAVYSGDANFAPSTGSLTLDVGGTVATGSFTLSATNVTVAQGSTGTSTITFTPGNGYKGTVDLKLSAPSLSDACATLSNVTVTGTTAQTTTVTLYTNAASCPANSVPLVQGGTGSLTSRAQAAANSSGSRHSPYKPAPLEFAAIGLLAAGFFGRRSRKLRSLLAIGLLAVIGVAVSGCGNNSAAPPVVNETPQGTYTITLTGTDSTTSTITSSTTFTLTVN